MGKFDKDSLGNRMKNYEAVTDTNLVPFLTTVIRVDGKAFRTFTKKLIKPFDTVLNEVMQKVMLSLSADFPGCKLGYTQSDEITLILTVDDPVRQESVYSGRIQKLASIAASKATRYFNMFWKEKLDEITDSKKNPDGINIICPKDNMTPEEKFKRLYIYSKKIDMAEFDARVFNIPTWDVINLLIWRQQDAVRNSISSVAHAYFSQKDLYKKDSVEMQDMLHKKKINWNDFPTYNKRGACCYKVEKEIVGRNGEKVNRQKWELDLDMPIITEKREMFEEIIFGKSTGNA